MSLVATPAIEHDGLAIAINGDDLACLVELCEHLNGYLFMSFDSNDETRVTWELVNKFCNTVISANSCINEDN